MVRTLGIISLILTLAACGVSPRRNVYAGQSFGANQGNGTGGYAGGQAGTNVPQLSSEPREALEQLDQYLQGQGYARIGPAVRNQNLPENGVIAYGIQAQSHLCYTIVALAQPNADLNMVVLDPAGRTIGYNVDPDSHPWVTVCPGQTGRAIARLQMAGGGGEYYYAVYQGPPSNRPDLTALWTGGGQQPQVQQAQLDPQTQQRLTQLDQQMQRENFERISEPQGIVYEEREDRNFALNLEEGFCYAFATLGGPGARDTDAFLVDGSGNEIERDVSTDTDAVVRYCPDQSGQYQLRTRMYGGSGPIFTVGYVQSQSGQQAGEAGPVMASASTAGAGLEENFRLLDADMRARGYEGFGEPSRGSLAQGETRDFQVSLEGGKCYAILAVGDNGVRDLDLTILDPRGRQLDRDVESDPRPIVRACADRSGEYTMQVRMYSGQGNFVYAPYRWPRGTRGPFGLNGLIYVRLAEMTSLLAVEGYEPSVDAAPGQGRLRSEGQSTTHDIQLEGGSCYSILVVGGEGVNNLDVTLQQGNTPLATDGSRTAFPNVRHCPQESGEHTLRIEAASGSGQYFYQVFGRANEG